MGYEPREITALHLADRFGMFLAIRWRRSIRRMYDDIRIFPAAGPRWDLT